MLELELALEIGTISSIVRPIFIARTIESTLATSSDEMVLVDAVNIARHLVDPLSHDLGTAALGGPREIADTISTAAGFVRDLPCHDGRALTVTLDESLHVLLERSLNWRLGVEIVVIFIPHVDGVDIHSAIVGPLLIVSAGHGLSGYINNARYS